MAKEFLYDVFLSHSSKDKGVVRSIAECLRADGLRVWFDDWEILPGDSIPAKIEEGLQCSRILVLCMSANAFGSDWPQLEAGTFRFRDPLNRERRFIPLRLDIVAIPGSLAQFLYIDWLVDKRGHAYAALLEACRSSVKEASSGEPERGIRRQVVLQGQKEITISVRGQSGHKFPGAAEQILADSGACGQEHDTPTVSPARNLGSIETSSVVREDQCSAVPFLFKVGGFPVRTRWAFIVVILLAACVAAVIALGRNTSRDLVIMVAQFDGPNRDRYRVTERLLAGLDGHLGHLDGIEIVTMNEVITDLNRSQFDSLSYKGKAPDVLIWGWYSVADQVQLRTIFELRGAAEVGVGFPFMRGEDSAGIFVSPKGDIESFKLQADLEREVTLLALFVVGASRFLSEEWEAAEDAFAKISNAPVCWRPDLQIAAMQLLARSRLIIGRGYGASIKGLTRMLMYGKEREALLDLRGLTYMAAGQYRLALADYDKLLEIRGANFRALMHRGFVYGYIGSARKGLSDLSAALKVNPRALLKL